VIGKNGYNRSIFTVSKPEVLFLSTTALPENI
jgi:hypothetical protein